MQSSSDPWYVHAILYTVIAVLTILLIKVAIIDPKEIVQIEKYNKQESRLRMTNIKEAEILWEKKFGTFTDDVDSLVLFIKNDPYVDSLVNAYDSLSRRSANPFKSLSNGIFIADSLKRTPKSNSFYILMIDTVTSIDTVVDRRGRMVRIDTTQTIGSRYYLEDPDGYGTVGSLDDDALKNTSSWD